MSTSDMEHDKLLSNNSEISIDKKPFQKPTKNILTKEDLDNFLTSEAHDQYFEFVKNLSSSMEGKTTTSKVLEEKIIVELQKVLDALKNLVDEIKPEPVGLSRFGNPAFKTWYTKAKKLIPKLLEEFVVPKEAIPEISKYLHESFGSAKRIDYGTGHEANFICFLLCLKKLNVIKETDYPALILRIFYNYISLMRKLQFTYWLEPAGSHGVWGLDDYHFLPFLFGSAQLKGHKHFKPKCIHDSEIVEEFSKDYMYLACIKFVNSVKPSASLRWHSPMLDDISIVKTWDKVNEGLIKMYHAEVLSKLPIMQHFLLGSLIKFDTGHTVPNQDSDDDSHDHCDDQHSHVYAFGQEAPTCCGMRVPSAISAAFGSNSNDSLPSRLPFD